MQTKRMSLAAAIAAALACGAAQAATTELDIYKAPNFQGRADTIKGEVANLENGFGREVSSLVARGGAWQVCTGDHFTGRCRVIREGRYPTLGWLDDKIVSVKFLGNAPDLARYDNWDKREARQEKRRDDNRDSRDTAQARDARDRGDTASSYGGEVSSYSRDYDRRNDNNDRRYDNGYDRR